MVTATEQFGGFPIVPGKQPCPISQGSSTISPEGDANLLHGGGANYLYMDGHVKWLAKEIIGQSVNDQLNLQYSSDQSLPIAF